ncbi:MAG: tetratricopeptide repeat protein [Candidatus Heimdallarchaeota archaeon]
MSNKKAFYFRTFNKLVMQLLFDSFIQRFPQELRNRLKTAVAHQTHLNPVERLHAGTCLVLKEQLAEIQELRELQTKKIDIASSKNPFNIFKKTRMKKRIQLQIKNKLILAKENAFQLASLSGYLIPLMRATKDYLTLLKQIEHPYVQLLYTYFASGGTNNQETREKIEENIKQLEQHPSYNHEMRGFVCAIRSWLYGTIGDTMVLKSIFKYIRERLPVTENIVEIRGLQDAATNAIWWFLHSGVESNIDEMISFLEPFILKYKLYMSYTDFLNLKGAVNSYFGNTAESIENFTQLMNEHEKYHNDYRLSIAIGNLAESFSAEGKIVKAKEMMERAIKLYKESTGRWPYLYLTEIGNIYYLMNDPRAEESFLQAFEIKKNETSLFKAFILFELIHFYLRTEQLDKVDAYLKEMRFLARELETLSVNASLDYLLGFNDMLQQNFSYAIKYLQSSLEQAHLSKNSDLILSNNILLAAIHLQRYRINEKDEELNNALNYLETAIKLAEEFDHVQVLAIGLVIRAYLNASKGEFSKAFDDLEQIKEISDRMDFEQWKQEYQTVVDLVVKGEKEGKLKVQEETIFKYILPQIKSMLSFKLPERKHRKSIVLGLLVINDSGIPVFTKLSKNLETDKLILSGLITAISHFSESIISGKDKGRLREILYEGIWLTTQPVKNGLVVVIAEEATAEIRIWASSIANRIKEVPAIVEMKNELTIDIDDILKQMNFS